MHIDVETIVKGARELEEDISPQAWEMDGLGVSFVDPIHVVGRFVKIESEILVDASMTLYRDIQPLR